MSTWPNMFSIGIERYGVFRIPEPTMEELELRDTKKTAKAKKISVPKLIKSNLGTRNAHKERKEYWR